MKKLYSSVRGTFDFNVSQSLAFRNIDQKARELFKLFNYEEIILPLLEEKELFIKGVGKSTDIIEKQMFKIEGKDIVLRPEGTAQVIRYYLQNSLYKQSDFHKFFYIGPMFRGERPQKGRLRQFHHLGAEAIGSSSFYLDAEMIILCLKILEKVGVKDKELKINTLGCLKDKGKFSGYIKSSLKNKKNALCNDCKKRLERNALRVLDCKNSQCKEVVASLKLSENYLCRSCKEHFKNLLSLLKDLDVKYSHDPFLVRGLDYYTNTVFEVISHKLGSQDAIGAGGRYNNLIKFLGGPDIPAIGFSLGLERILLVLEQSKDDLSGRPLKQAIDVFVAVRGENLRKTGFDILNRLRKERLACDYDYCGKSLKGQLRTAQKKGAADVVILGDEEVKEGCVLLKDMSKGTQEKVKIERLVTDIYRKRGYIRC